MALPDLEDIKVERINERESDNKVNKRNLDIDMNPMVDLAFLLLTFFMLATTFSKPQAMELLIPAKPEEKEEQEMAVKESKTISLDLMKDKVIWYQGITDPDTHHVSYNQLEPTLSRLNGEIDEMVVLIKPLPSSTYGHLVDVFDALNYSEVGRYALSDLSEFDESLEAATEASSEPDKDASP
jgi:biopolymer transport protein ExbD